MQTSRILLVLASLVSLAACASDKYSKIPEPSGPWQPANTDQASVDNNIVPLNAYGSLP